jgi:hypothetical protein
MLPVVVDIKTHPEYGTAEHYAPGEPRVVDTSEEQRQYAVFEIKGIAENVKNTVLATGKNPDMLIDVMVTLMEPVVVNLVEFSREEYYQNTNEVLTLELAFRVLITRWLMAAYVISPSMYFQDAKQKTPHYVHPEGLHCTQAQHDQMVRLWDKREVANDTDFTPVFLGSELLSSTRESYQCQDVRALLRALCAGPRRGVCVYVPVHVSVCVHVCVYECVISLYVV